MTSLKENILLEINNLIKQGNNFLSNLEGGEEEEVHIELFQSNYQLWYTKALAPVQSLLPGRLKDFKAFYKDYIEGILINNERLSMVDGFRSTTSNAVDQQILILKSIIAFIDNIIYNINNVINKELSNSDLNSAKNLLNSNYLRAAGAIAGLVLERHLRMVCIKNGYQKIDNRCPEIKDYRKHLLLKEIIDYTDNNGIERLATIRNLCCHAKDREPRREEVYELIQGVERIIAKLT
ncbi:MAG: hypothetical protein NTY36_16455 [Deltaproteobacteria bacterium]|nr:hypothetical protein [Deltaproteobacteria bacterium]